MKVNLKFQRKYVKHDKLAWESNWVWGKHWVMDKIKWKNISDLVATVPQRAGCIAELRHFLPSPPGLEEWGVVGVWVGRERAKWSLWHPSHQAHDIKYQALPLLIAGRTYSWCKHSLIPRLIPSFYELDTRLVHMCTCIHTHPQSHTPSWGRQVSW